MGTTPQVESCQLFSFFFCDERERENFPYFSGSPPRFLPHRNNKVFLLPMKSHRTLRRSLRNAPKALLFPCFSLSFISRLLAELHGGSTFIIAMKSATRKWRRGKEQQKKNHFYCSAVGPIAMSLIFIPISRVWMVSMDTGNQFAVEVVKARQRASLRANCANLPSLVALCLLFVCSLHVLFLSFPSCSLPNQICLEVKLISGFD